MALPTQISQLGEYYNKTEFSDVKIIYSNKSIAAHNVVICSKSKVLRAPLQRRLQSDLDQRNRLLKGGLSTNRSYDSVSLPRQLS